MIKHISLFSVFITGLFIFSCETDEKSMVREHNTEKKLNDTINIYINDTVTLSIENLSLILSGIEDSRCPKGYYCIWQGNAKAEFTAKFEDCNKNFELNTAFVKAVVINGFIIELIDVFPYPGAINPPSEEQYCKFVIKRASNNLIHGIVKNYAGLDGCGYIIELDNGTKLEPAELKMDFYLKDNQSVMLRYNELNDRASICMAGVIAEIVEIYEVVE